MLILWFATFNIIFGVRIATLCVQPFLTFKILVKTCGIHSCVLKQGDLKTKVFPLKINRIPAHLYSQCFYPDSSIIRNMKTQSIAEPSFRVMVLVLLLPQNTTCTSVLTCGLNHKEMSSSCEVTGQYRYWWPWYIIHCPREPCLSADYIAFKRLFSGRCMKLEELRMWILLLASVSVQR